MPSLLQQAKATNTTRKHRAYTKEEIELVEAWIDGEVSLKQLGVVMKFANSANAYVFIALVCREMLRSKK